MHKSAESVGKRCGNSNDLLHTNASSFLFALILIQFSFTGCYNETAENLVMPEKFTVADGKFVGRNNEKPVIVIMVEKGVITLFTYEFKNTSGYSCNSGSLVGSAQEPIAGITNNTFSISHGGGNGFEISGKFVSNDSCTGTWNSQSSNSPCLASITSGSWVAVR